MYGFLWILEGIGEFRLLWCNLSLIALEIMFSEIPLGMFLLRESQRELGNIFLYAVGVSSASRRDVGVIFAFAAHLPPK